MSNQEVAGEADASARRLSYTPVLPDGVDCPWIRGRSTRWWLVVPADLLAVSLVALLGAASTDALGSVLSLAAPLWQAACGAAVGWAVSWLACHRRGDHLEMAAPEGLIVAGATWVVWTVLHVAGQGAAPLDRHVSWAVMTGTFLLVFLGGWRWLYGYVRAHDSLVPAPLARRISEQEADQGEGRV
ncbi:DUF3054 domain-containing protein [Actinomyces lilanjuaniae]|uniref:DUF3054 domain-containing protein n=1 Tax=Actinomyces lilanjuaniae TaxID=2321394 RepID=UPI00311AB882